MQLYLGIITYRALNVVCFASLQVYISVCRSFMNYWNESIVIRSCSYPRFMGAPLDGVTNVPFRKTVRLFSPSVLLYSEMCHVDTIATGKKQDWLLEPTDTPINFQIAAADETDIVRACQYITQAGISMVDINIGCPAGSVVRDGLGAGSALMGDITRLRAIVSLLRANLSCILTAKMRAGFRTHVALDVAMVLEDLGVEAICVHPRLQTQKFSGEPDYRILTDIKKVVSIPVLVSGGITNFSVARSVFEHTGVDGFLIGRALMGRPWLLQQCIEESQGRSCCITSEMIQHALLYHLDYAVHWFGQSRGLGIFKKHLKVYLEQLGFMRDRSVELLNMTCPQQLKVSFEVMLSELNDDRIYSHSGDYQINL